MNACACEVGWKGEKCDMCVPYWNCPNNITDPNDLQGIAENGLACEVPNQCWCKIGSPIWLKDKKRKCICNAASINGIAHPPLINSEFGGLNSEKW